MAARERAMVNKSSLPQFRCFFCLARIFHAAFLSFAAQSILLCSRNESERKRIKIVYLSLSVCVCMCAAYASQRVELREKGKKY
jgi:hypothetical protein